MPAWVRRNLDDARLLLLYSRHDFVTGDWPEPLALGVADQARRFKSCLERFAGLTWGGVDATSLRLSQFVLADAPLAAVRPHLQRRETPPALVDETSISSLIGSRVPRVGPSGRVTGLDLNEGMLAVARRLRPEIDWRQGDAAKLPFEDSAFDVVVSQFALMFFPDRVAAVREGWNVESAVQPSVWVRAQDTLSKSIIKSRVIGTASRLVDSSI